MQRGCVLRGIHAERARKVAVVSHRANRVDGLCGCPEYERIAPVAQVFRIAAALSAGHRQARGHRLDHHASERFVPIGRRSIHEAIERAQERRGVFRARRKQFDIRNTRELACETCPTHDAHAHSFRGKRAPQGGILLVVLFRHVARETPDGERAPLRSAATRETA
jgi:hypothetical protein